MRERQKERITQSKTERYRRTKKLIQRKPYTKADKKNIKERGMKRGNNTF